MSTMGVSVIDLGTPRNARENFGWTMEHLGEPVTGLVVQMRSLRAPGIAGAKPGSADDKSQSTGDKSGSTSNHNKSVWNKPHLLWEHCWWTWKS